MNRVLALDFDGVIWDSAGECYEVGWRAYLEMTGRDLSSPETREGFLAGRPLARAGRDFYLILKLLEEEPQRDLSSFPHQEFLELRRRFAAPCEEFDHRFYQLRAHYRDQEPEQWTSWQGAFPQMLSFMDEWEGHFAGAALATTKDSRSAEALLATTGRTWPVFGKEFSLSKTEQILGIARQFQVQPQEILFLDDLLENLEQVAPTGATVALAAWGYNTPESRNETRQAGYPVVDFENLPGLARECLQLV